LILYIYTAKYNRQVIGNDPRLHRSGEKKIKIKWTEIKPIPYRLNHAENPNEFNGGAMEKKKAASALGENRTKAVSTGI
jgi:hypothetical protein